MARLPYVEPTALPDDQRDLLVRPIHLYRAMVNAPGLTRAFLGLANTIRYKSVLDARLRELAILQVAWETRSAYEWSHHVKIGRQFGVTNDDIRAICSGDWRALDVMGRSVVEAARNIASHGDLPEEHVAELRRELGDEAATEMLLIASLYVGLARFLHVARIEVEEDYMPELDEFPMTQA